MKAVVLSAGEGTWLRLPTEDKPKGLVEVDGIHILTYCYRELAEVGADELVVVVGYQGAEHQPPRRRIRRHDVF